jgi:hypothetical protein
VKEGGILRIEAFEGTNFRSYCSESAARFYDKNPIQHSSFHTTVPEWRKGCAVFLELQVFKKIRNSRGRESETLLVPIHGIS